MLANAENDGTSTSSGYSETVDAGLVSARIVVAVANELMHPLLAHFAEHHRRPGGCLQRSMRLARRSA
jgi:hypothetical protein